MNQPTDPTTSLAIFDLDGTLTTKDSFLAYLLTLGRRFSRYRAMAKMPWLIGCYLGKLMKDYQLKQRLIGDFFDGVDNELVSNHSAWFCENWLPRHLHPIGHPLLQSHQRAGHRVILLSASPDIYVPQVAESLGIDEVVCTRVKQSGGVWCGELLGKNCKGDEKLAAMTKHLGFTDTPPSSFSYGDSQSDFPVLAWVQHGAWIRRDRMIPLDGVAASAFPDTSGIVSRTKRNAYTSR